MICLLSRFLANATIRIESLTLSLRRLTESASMTDVTLLFARIGRPDVALVDRTSLLPLLFYFCSNTP